MTYVREKERWELAVDHILPMMKQGWQVLLPDEDDASGERKSLGKHLKGSLKLKVGVLKETFVAFMGDGRGTLATVMIPGMQSMALRRHVKDGKDLWCPEMDLTYHAPKEETVEP